MVVSIDIRLAVVPGIRSRHGLTYVDRPPVQNLALCYGVCLCMSGKSSEGSLRDGI